MACVNVRDEQEHGLSPPLHHGLRRAPLGQVERPSRCSKPAGCTSSTRPTTPTRPSRVTPPPIPRASSRDDLTHCASSECHPATFHSRWLLCQGRGSGKAWRARTRGGNCEYGWQQEAANTEKSLMKRSRQLIFSSNLQVVPLPHIKRQATFIF